MDRGAAGIERTVPKYLFYGQLRATTFRQWLR